jgi:hypothetical protein
MTDTRPACDTYVYREGYRYTWNCACGARGQLLRRLRRDADDEANAHMEASRG